MYASNINKKKAILFTSAREKEGKSFIVNNIAVAFAQANKKVLIVDTNLRTPKGRSQIFENQTGEGLSDFIKEITDSGETNKISFDRKISQNAKLYVTGKVHASQSMFSDIVLNIPLTPVNISVSNGKRVLIDISSAFFNSIGDNISARILVTSVDLSPDGISAFNIVLQTKNILPTDMYYATLNIYCNE